MRDYYYILGITQNATEQEIKTAYRKLSMKFHPDKNSGEKFFEERFKEIQEGYEILSNQTKRREYDSKLNQFNSTRTNRDNLKNEEEELKRKFEEEFRKREDEIKRKFQARESRIKADAERKIREETTKPQEPLNTEKGGNSYSALILTLIVIAAVSFLFYYLVNKENANKESEIANQDSILYRAKLDSMLQSINDSSSKSFYNISEIELVLDSNNQIKLSDFPSTDYIAEHKDWIKFNFTDIDNDFIPELETRYFTGGAHCCFVYNIFKQTSKNTFTQIFSFEGGENSLSIEDDGIYINFFEQLGYFFTCYACSIDDSLPNGYFRPHLTLNYSQNGFTLAPKDDYLDRIIFEDLEYLKNRPIPKIDSTRMDDGTRKAFAEHIITYHFNNQENSDSTKFVFDKYYLGEDSLEIWETIKNHVNSISNMEYAMTYHTNEINREIGNAIGDTTNNQFLNISGANHLGEQKKNK